MGPPSGLANLMEHGLDVQPYVWVSFMQKYVSCFLTIQKRCKIGTLEMIYSRKLLKLVDEIFSTLNQ